MAKQWEAILYYHHVGPLALFLRLEEESLVELTVISVASISFKD